MALTRAKLKGMELDDEQINEIIKEHVEVTNALKEQRDEYKKEADKLADVQEELTSTKEKLKTTQKEFNDFKNSVEQDAWQTKYEEEHKQFEAYKADVTEKETTRKVQNAYKDLLLECKVGNKFLDSILKVTNFKDLKLKEDGTLDNVDALKESISKDWSGFITVEGTKGAGVEEPPAGGSTDGAGTSRAAELAAKYRKNLYGTKKEE